jgi:hypothetical protein
MQQPKRDLWSLVRGAPQVDPSALADALVDQVRRNDLDYRSRWLIHDSLDALQDYWGPDRLRRWLSNTPERQHFEDIWEEEFERVGFPTLRSRLMDATQPEVIQDFMRELGSRVRSRKPIKLAIGGSVALILKGYLSRNTEDIDVVDEVPAEIRQHHQLLDELKQRFGIYIAHFQSHYLPMRWEQRLHYQGQYGDLAVYLVDLYDVVLSKLFSRRTKDIDDLRMLRPQLDKEMMARRMNADMQAYLANDNMRERAEQNWYILYGEKLPHEHQPPTQPAPSP